MIVKLIKSLFSNSSAADLRDFLSQQPILLDVRTRAEFMGGSIQGAQNVPLGDLTSSMNRLNKTNRSWCFVAAETAVHKPLAC
jgi:rhodanese-related sulfurtransferase